MAQTPAQRRANARFAKAEEVKRGKPVVKKKEVEKAPIPRWIIVLLIFVVCGGAVFELLRLFFPVKTPGE